MRRPRCMTPTLARLLRVYAVIALLGALALGLLPQLSHASARANAELRIPWYALTVLFALVEVCVLHAQVRREAQTVSLCDRPRSAPPLRGLWTTWRDAATA